MRKITYISKLVLYVGLWLTIKVMPAQSVKNHLPKKISTTLNNWSLLETISNEDLIVEDGDNDAADNDYTKNHIGEDIRSGFNGVFGVLEEVEKSGLTKFLFSFYKSTHLFILFHRWKFLCL